MWNEVPEIEKEMRRVEAYIRSRVKSRNRLLSTIAEEQVSAGGKRLRPAFVVLSAHLGQYDSEKVVPLAGAIEILHTATLVHDDIIDRAGMRRGKPTVSSKFGTDMAVYTGDFLFTKAVLMLSGNIQQSKLDIVARAVKTICEGEVDQFQERYDLDTSIPSYLKRINRKTAVLFAAACSLGADSADCPPEMVRKLGKFGFCYGMAFQIRDDLNDYLSDADTSGKPVGSDLLKGILTLPVIYAVHLSQAFRSRMASILSNKEGVSVADLAEVYGMMTESGGMDSSEKLLARYIAKGLKILDSLPQNRYVEILRKLISGLKV